MDPLIVVTVVVALAFDFVNGFHDAANAIATVVSTRVLTPRLAVAWAAFFNFAAVFVFGVHVAKMVGTGVVAAEAIQVTVILSGLVGAIAWNLITWRLGLPSSSSHALIGGYAGAAVAFNGWEMLQAEGLLIIVGFIVLAPLIGMILALINQVIVLRICRRRSPRSLTQTFRGLQLLSSAIYSFSHGTNDAQKTMGIIFALLIAGGVMGSNHVPLNHDSAIPTWVVFSCYAMIACGTLFGGFRIVKTMGTKLTKLDPMHGFCAETGGGVTILAVSALGIPVSTTHTITGAIIGVGLTGGPRAVRWKVAGRIVWAWVLTIPMAAAMAALFYWLVGQHLG